MTEERVQPDLHSPAALAPYSCPFCRDDDTLFVIGVSTDLTEWIGQCNGCGEILLSPDLEYWYVTS